MALTINRFLGFETGGVEEFVSITNTSNLVSSASAAHTGTYGVRVNGGSRGRAECYGNITSQGDTHIFGGWVRCTGSGAECNLSITDSSYNRIIAINGVEGSGWRVVGAVAGTQLGTLTAGTWYFVECAFSNTNGGSISMWVDGTLLFDGVTRGDISGTIYAIEVYGQLGTHVDWDDIYYGSGASALSDRLGDCRVYEYRSDITTATPDVGDDLDSATWDRMQAVPWNGNLCAYTDSAAKSGEITTDDSTYGGPSGAGLTGTNVAIQMLFIANRGNGSGTTHSVRIGRTGSVEQIDVTLDSASATYFRLPIAMSTRTPSTSQYGRIGFRKSAGGRSFVMTDAQYMLLHVPDAGIDDLQTVTGSYAITGSAANLTVNRNLDTTTGSYSHTGQAVDFAIAKRLELATGSYSYSGQAADFSKEYALDTVTGSYSYTGSDASLTVQRYMETHVEQVQLVRFITVETVKSWTNSANAVDGSTATYAFSTTDAPGGAAANILLSNPNYSGPGYPGRLISKVRARLYASVTGTGTPKLHYRFRYDDYDYEYASGDLTNSTPGWSSYIDLTSIQNVWTQDEIYNHNQVRLYGYDDTGTFTEARSYQTEYEVTRVYDQYRVLGQTVTFKRALVLSAETGTYSYSGQAALVGANLNLLTNTGSYSHTGQDPTLTYVQPANELLVDTGSYSHTGQAADLLFNATVQTVTGSYSITGQPADFVFDAQLNTDTGAYSVTGNAADLLADRQLASETGSYSIAGQPAALSKGTLLLTVTGSYSVTGNAIELDRSLQLEAETGSYSVAGQAAELDKSVQLLLETGSYSVAGNQASLDKSLRIQLDTGAYSYSGQTLELDKSSVLSTESGTYTYTGQAAELDRQFLLNADSGAYTYTGQPADFISPSAYELEGFRFRNDDGDEANATWREAQDTDITETTGVNVRLRTLVDVTGNPGPNQVTLQYRKVGDATWRTVQ